MHAVLGINAVGLAFAGLEPRDLDAVAYSYDPSLAPRSESPIDEGWEALRTLYAQRAPRSISRRRSADASSATARAGAACGRRSRAWRRESSCSW